MNAKTIKEINPASNPNLLNTKGREKIPAPIMLPDNMLAGKRMFLYTINFMPFSDRFLGLYANLLPFLGFRY